MIKVAERFRVDHCMGKSHQINEYDGCIITDKVFISAKREEIEYIVFFEIKIELDCFM